MRQTFERSTAATAIVLLAIVLIAPAQAGGLTSSAEDATGSIAPQCGDCPRIRGHIPAASDIAGVEAVAGRPPSFPSPPASSMAGFSAAAGPRGAESLGRGLFFMPVRHDETAR